MAWETRKGRQYYYTKERRGARVISRYIGAGPTAELIADIEQARRQQAMLDAEQARLPAELVDLDQTIADLSRQIADVVALELQAAGYHQHKRQWRKRRDNNSSAG